MPGYFQEAKLNFYVDDTAISVQSQCPFELEYKLQEQVNLAAQWLLKNCLSVNVAKTKIMIVGTRHMVSRCDDLSISYKGTVIEKVEHFKYLRIVLGNTLTLK